MRTHKLPVDYFRIHIRLAAEIDFYGLMISLMLDISIHY